MGPPKADYGPTDKWRQIVDTVQAIARFACKPDDLRIGLASVTPGWDEESMICPPGQIGSGGDAGAIEGLRGR